MTGQERSVHYIKSNLVPWVKIREKKNLKINTETQAVHHVHVPHEIQEDLLDNITALLKFKSSLSTTVAAQCRFQSSP